MNYDSTKMIVPVTIMNGKCKHCLENNDIIDESQPVCGLAFSVSGTPNGVLFY